jgi:hypothetical protein
MPIQPIDLQTLFAHLHHVGKGVASERAASAVQQASQAGEMVQRSQEEDSSVPETRDTDGGDGLDKVRDEESRQDTRQGSGKREREEEAEEQERKTVYEDPDLGHHVDISG